MIISAINAYEILDSRGNPTVKAEVLLEDGSYGWAAVPSGASTGKYEALELRDGEPRFKGKGVLRAIKNIKEVIAPKLIGLSALEQEEIDRIMIELDGTENKSNLGANALLAVSLATAKAAAEHLGLPLYQYLGGISANTLPIPILNLINGGKHAPEGADFQEFLLLPMGLSFKRSLQMGVEVYYSLKELLKESNLSTLVGDEGGFAPAVESNRRPLELLSKAIEASGYKLGEDCFLGLDVASSSFYQDGWYHLTKEGKRLSGEELIEYYVELATDFPLVYLEDGLSEEDWAAWVGLNHRLGDKLLIVGDDLFVTNVKRLRLGIEKRAANSILIKPNQIGTLTETLECLRKAKEADFKAVISHRSGETMDDFIADLAVGLNAGFIKSGAPCRGERTAKYNRLLEIEQELGKQAIYPSYILSSRGSRRSPLVSRRPILFS